MANNKDTKAGLGSPTGVDEGLFAPVQSPPQEQPQTARQPVQEVNDQTEREKKTLTFDPTTVDLLDDLKRFYKRQTRRSVSYGEILDKAVYELAIKEGLAENNP